VNPRKAEQVANRIQVLVSDILSREVSDPRLSTLVLNRVELARDGSYAKIFVSSYMPEVDVEGIEAALKRASGYIRKLLAGKLDLRIVPDLRFKWDNSVKEGEEVLSALRKLNIGED
jgi:ribosome-binding factor A